MTQYDHLLGYIPDLSSRRILDLGSGYGSFLIEATKRGIRACGIERSSGFIDAAKESAKLAGVLIDIRSGMAESIPFDDQSFDFVNVCEVIEHVDDPDKVLSEMYRVLDVGGMAYVSVPNRYCFLDPHFHLYFVNWLPRSFSDVFISIFGNHKDYERDIGKERLKDLYYATFKGAKRKAESHGFKVEDMRLIKISKKFPNPIMRFFVRLLYFPARFLYLNSCHLLLTKQI